MCMCGLCAMQAEAKFFKAVGVPANASGSAPSASASASATPSITVTASLSNGVKVEAVPPASASGSQPDRS